MRLSLFSRCTTLPQILLYTVLFCLSFVVSATADPKQLNLFLSSQPNQSFQTLLQEAESLAKNSIQQSFQSSPDRIDISVNILGEHYGQQVPLLSVTVSQTNWHRDPKVQSWAKYFNNASQLLGFSKYAQPSSFSVLAQPIGTEIEITENEPNFYQ